MTSKEFSLKIENIVKEKSISHMDAVLWYCKEHSIDEGTVGNLISKSLKEKETIRIQKGSLVLLQVENREPKWYSIGQEQSNAVVLDIHTDLAQKLINKQEGDIVKGIQTYTILKIQN